MPVSEETEDDKYDIDGNDVFTLDYKEETENLDPFSKSADEIKALSGVTSNMKRKITTMEKRYTGADDAGSKAREDNYVTGYNAFDVVLPPHSIESFARLYTVSSYHFGAINAKVSNIVGLGFDFVESRTAKRLANEVAESEPKKKKLRKRLAEGKDELLDIVDTLNDEDSLEEVLTKVWIDYEATGNGYIEIGRTNTGRVGYIGHVDAPSIRVRRDRDGFVQIVGNKAVFFRNFGKQDANPLGNDNNPNEIIHIKKYAPGNGYYGIPDILAAKQAVAGNEFSSRFNIDYFEHKAIPRHVVILKGATINPKLSKNILEFLETGVKGKNHRTIFVPLPASTDKKKVELEFKAIEAGTQDASFNNYRKSNKEEILVVHRVPITKISVGEGVNLAVARDADKTFKEQVCRPQQSKLEKKLNKVFREFTDLFDFKLNEMTLTDEDTQSKIDERYLKAGVILRNEVRARKGMPSIPKGDEIIDINKPEQLSQVRGQGNRERDSQRSAAATDSAGEGRNTKGEGRTT